MTDFPDRPPPLVSMFINSTDTLRHRQLDQKMIGFQAWNDKPPLFTQYKPKSQRFWQAPVDTEISEQEDPTLLKGVSQCLLASCLHPEKCLMLT
jgi:hypothetical protein